MIQKSKAKGIAIDLSASAAESGAELLLDNLPTLSSKLAQIGLEGASAFLADGAINAISPRLAGLIMDYKLRRAERNIISLIDELAKNMDEINHRLDSFDEEKKLKFIDGIYRDSFLDIVAEEPDPTKVQFAINAFANLMEENSVSDSFVLTLFDDLSRLNSLDLRVLKLHGNPSSIGYEIIDSYQKLVNEENIEAFQYRHIREKLCRFGLLQSKNEKRRNENLVAIEKYVADLAKQLSAGKEIRPPRKPNIQKIGSNDSYAITPLGNNYLRLVGPIQRNEKAK